MRGEEYVELLPEIAGTPKHFPPPLILTVIFLTTRVRLLVFVGACLVVFLLRLVELVNAFRIKGISKVDVRIKRTIQ